MAHGRLSVVLGVHSSLGAIVQICQSAAGKAGQVQPGLPVRNRLTDVEIAAVMGQLSQLDAFLRRESISVCWSSMGTTGSLARNETLELLKFLNVSVSEAEVLAVGDLEGGGQDAIVYVPLDVQQPRQVEQLARLSMLSSRVRHVAFAVVPKWNHAQLMALRETWEWIDPKNSARVLAFGEEIVRSNGGITRRELSKIDLPERKEEHIDPVIITRSPRMKEIMSLADAVADTDSTVLISGESGTGKELIAQRIHGRCHRANKAIVAVNCAAIPEELLESELFGHVKGAFTGAHANREGRFEAAEGGTLFLDEIGEMGPNLQVKLLRVLQTRRYEPVGSTKTKSSDVRIVAATNRDLESDVRESRFREDLFYRLNVIPIHIPALRERKEDVQLLVDHFVRKFNREKARRVTGVTRASLRALVAYDWPGNIRELENLMERMVILKSSGMIDVLDFPEKYRRKTLSEIEYDDLMNASKSIGSAQAAKPVNEVAPSMSGQAAIIDDSGEEGIMKISGNTFTKAPIGQSAQSATATSADMTPVHSGSDVDALAAISDSLSVDQAIRLIADRMAFPTEGLDFNSVVDQFENILILRALERTGWNRNRAAGLLRLNRTTLVEKLKKKQLLPPLRFGDAVMEGNA